MALDAEIQKEINRRKTEIKGLEVLGFLRTKYEVNFRIRSGSNWVFDVKKDNGHTYTVRFQLAKWSVIYGNDQYRNVTCNCPRFCMQTNCHHVLLAYAVHKESSKNKIDLTLFANFELSKVNRKLLEAA